MEGLKPSSKESKLQQQIDDLTKQLEKLKNIQMYGTAEGLSNEQNLAIMLHKRYCKWNHTDGCGWYYEIIEGRHKWEASEHAKWLRKAQAILSIISFDAATQLLSTDVFSS